MSKHTPGPWTVVETPLVGGRMYRVCSVGETVAGMSITDPDAEGNAHLISAAPVMHALYEASTVLIDEWVHSATVPSKPWKAFLAAVAKVDAHFKAGESQ